MAAYNGGKVRHNLANLAFGQNDSVALLKSRKSEADHCRCCPADDIIFHDSAISVVVVCGKLYRSLANYKEIIVKTTTRNKVVRETQIINCWTLRISRVAFKSTTTLDAGGNQHCWLSDIKELARDSVPSSGKLQKLQILVYWKWQHVTLLLLKPELECGRD